MLLNNRPPFKYVLSKLTPEIYYVCLTSAAIYAISIAFKHAIPPVPITIPTFLGTAISIILSFKLNQSYDRWWEARKIWGSIVNDSRNLVIQLQSFVTGGNKEIIRAITYRQIAWCYALGRSLRGLDALDRLDRLVDTNELENYKAHVNKPLALLQQNAADITELRTASHLDPFSHVQINNTQVSLTNSMGMAERIKSTVFPSTYRLFLHMIIYVFTIILTIALRDIEFYIAVPTSLIIACFFFLLERTATHLQDPFSNRPTDTAMTAIATTIEINLKQLIGEANVPEPCKPNDFYLN
ncbi:hypothetical protein DYU05_18700 [Mucilaginibacter terrenus]|uniref:Bestrophin n=1 Tax=Mucilaginibacter terrenus TaxID=2482727 RepID=A0A3E2NLR7_9SPHI|nr:bestrophin family ion channel [Mucilaginibacter terrenus]RFZ81850.1 hypothetical protein DYU05_18700 [Mucilaginibacter terrenus]